MKKIFFVSVLFVFLAFNGCAKSGNVEVKKVANESQKVSNETQKQESSKKELYKNEKYGFSLEFPSTWMPIEEKNKGPFLEEYDVDTFKLTNKDLEVAKIGNTSFYLKSMDIGVVELKDVEKRKHLTFEGATMEPLYKEFLGKNDKYAFFHDTALLYMYPYACNNIEGPEEAKLCDKYKPTYEEGQDIVKSFKAI
ncbi:hypothetical protein HZC20_01490 [Candidatus Peregrinibacteria bacterium]|nr:hypothetical protein [Candidatus Peregrinibacteria bacterium]